MTCTVAIVGGGTAGLALATALKHRGVSGVIVLEREHEAGGVPRHCGHYPFGVYELKRFLKGPDYARKLVQKALAAGVDIRTNTTVTALHPNARLSLSSPAGILELQADRVVLCTGVRESSRAQRFLGGQRPMGVMSTGALQSMVYLHDKRPFRKPVILGTELVSFSAIMTCHHKGIRPITMLEENDRVTARQFMRFYLAIKGIGLKCNVRNLRIIGDQVVEAVEYTDASGARQIIKTDGVIVTGGFRPESALLHASHIEVDPATGGPSVDQYGRSSDPHYFCTGNLLRPVETSSWCWHEAVECAVRIVQDLAQPVKDYTSFPLHTADPAIRFIVPQRLILSDAPNAMENLQIRLNQPVKGHLAIHSGDKVLWSNFIHSRPERRILAPLAPIIKAGLTAPVEIEIRKIK